MGLKKKTIKGVFWNGIELFGGRFIQIVISIVLARLLLPEDFGAIGLLIIFTELSKVLLDSGFSQALIRKQDVNQLDYSSIFYFNILVGLVLYIILYFVSPLISQFYQFEALTNIARVAFLSVFINAFGITQNAKIVQQVDFKKLASRTIIANLFSGAIAIYLAYMGYGVWSLVIQIVLASFLRVLLLWMSSKWLPSFIFSLKPIKDLFPFSSNLLVSGLLDVMASNIQTLLIGKFYTKAQLGYYTQARLISGIPSQTFTTIIKNVTYPTLSVLQNDIKKLKGAYRNVIRIAVFVVFPLMLGLMAIGNELIPILLGEKWRPAIPYFIVLCGAGAIYPLYVLGQNIFLVLGNSKLHLKVGFIKRIISLVMILITIKISVFALVVGHLIATIINSCITMYFSGRLIGYSFLEQIKDLRLIFLISLIMFATIFLMSLIFYEESITLLLMQLILGVSIYFGLSYLFNKPIIKLVKDNLKL